MADKTDSTAPAVVAPAAPALSVRSVRVVEDSINKSPHGWPLDIVEVELYPYNQGNGEWMQWRDVIRFSCERGKADRLLVAMGLKAK